MRSETSKKILSETSEETRQKVKEETNKHLSKMKTIKEWLHELPEPYRTEALENCTNAYEEVEMLSVAITNGFVWYRTKGGQDYWENLYKKLISEGK